MQVYLGWVRCLCGVFLAISFLSAETHAQAMPSTPQPPESRQEFAGTFTRVANQAGWLE